MKAKYLVVNFLAAMAFSVPAADATVILTFGQASTGDTVTASQVGASTTITSDATVDITEIDAIVGTPVATFTLTATSIGPATMVGSNIEQHYSGTFSITSGANNYLSGTFSDALFGSGSALAITASNAVPGESITFSSNVIAPGLVSAFDRDGIALSFTDVRPGASIVGGTLGSFRSDVSGDFSSSVPEPSTWAMMLLGFAGLGYVGFRKARVRSAISIV